MQQKPSRSFLDEFYNLSSNDQTLRSKSAQSITKHCFSSSSSSEHQNEDKYYTLKRLFKGICSSRLSSRQGFASCLISFLTFVKKNEKETEWILEQKSSTGSSVEECVYDIYVKETLCPTKGSDERDYMYGKLFGFLALVRSGMLTLSSTSEVGRKYVQDIIQVYQTKEYMKEGIISALILLLESGDDSETKNEIVSLIEDEILFKENSEEEGKKEWDMNELALGIHMYRSTPKNKKLKVFDPSSESLQNGVETLYANSSTGSHYHVIWKELFKCFTSLEENDAGKTKIAKFVIQDILQEQLLKDRKNVEFGLTAVLDYLPTLTPALIEELISKEIITKLWMELVVQPTNTPKHKKGKKNQSKQDSTNNASAIWTKILSKYSSDQSFMLYKLITKYQPFFLKHASVKSIWEDKTKITMEQKNEYLSFVQEMILSNKEGLPLSDWMDIVYHIPSSFPSKKGSSKEVYASITLFFMSCAFQTSKKDTSSLLPVEVRRIASSRFYSMITDMVQMNCFQQPAALQVGTVYTVLDTIYESYKKNTKLYSIHADYQSKRVEIMSTITDLQSLLVKADDRKSSLIQGCCNLIYFLFFQLFHVIDTTMDEEKDADDDVLEELDVLITDINHIAHQFLNTPSSSKEEENPFTLLVDVCVTILSFYNHKHSGKDRGSSVKLLQRMVKMSFRTCLKYAADEEEKKFHVDDSVMEVLLEAVCVDYFAKKENDEGESDEDDEGSSSDDDSSEEEDNVFITAATMKDLDLGGVDIDDGSTSSSSINEDEKEDVKMDDTKEGKEVHLEPSAVQSYLLNSDSEEELTQHDASADPALSKLLKLKQEQRKKAQVEKQSIQLSHQLRCISLLECLFQPMMINTINHEVLCMSMVALLGQRRLLEKQIVQLTASSSNENKSKEQALLLDKIDHLITDNVCKIKLSSASTKTQKDPKEMYIHVLQTIIQEVKLSASPKHTKYCSACFFVWTKYILSSKEILKKDIMELCEGLVKDWSSVRNTNIHTSFFFDLASRNICLARILFTPYLIHANTNARTSFIKSEAFQLLSMFYNNAKQDDNNDDPLQDESIATLKSSIANLSTSLQSTYKDEEMCKAKRMNYVLKTNTCLIQFVTSTANTSSASFWNGMKELVLILKPVQTNSSSVSIKTKCENIIKSIQKESVSVGSMEEEKEDRKSPKKEGAGKKKKKKSTGSKEDVKEEKDTKKSKRRKIRQSS